MAEFEYRGYRVRTLFEKDWTARIWPPLTPPRIIERVRTSHAEGEDVCRSKVTALIDDVVAGQAAEKRGELR